MIVVHCPICGGRAELRALQAHYDAECVACEWWFVVPELAAARGVLASNPYATLVDLFSMRLLPPPASWSGSRNLDQLAAHGPLKDHRMTEASLAVEEIHRLVIRRSIRADEKAWAKDCPKPKGWVDE